MDRFEKGPWAALVVRALLLLIGTGLVLFVPSLSALAGEVVVQVEVTRDEQPVSGLMAEDFVIRDKGKSVPILEVFEVAAGADTGAVPDEAYRRVHLLFDLEFSSPHFVMQATDLARVLITPERLTRTEVSIAVHEPSAGLRIEVDPTDDPDSLGEMLDTLRSESERRLAIWAQAAGPVVGGDDLITSRARDTESAKGIVQQAQGRILGLIKSLARLEPLTRSVPGSSRVVVFSPGFDSSVVLGNQTTDRFDAAWAGQRSEAAVQGNVSAVDGASRYRGGLVEEALFEMLSVYDRSGVPIQAVDIELTDATRMIDRGARGPNGLTIMTDRTGGEVFRGSREDLLEEFQARYAMDAAFYLLTFQPRSGESGRYRKLDVRTKDRLEGVEVLAPPGYYVP